MKVFVLFLSMSYLSIAQCTNIYDIAAANGDPVTVGSITLSYAEGSVNGGILGVNAGNGTTFGGTYTYTNISGDIQSINNNGTTWKDYVYIKLTFSAETQIGNSFSLIDIDGGASNFEMAGIFGRNAAGTQINPTLTCGSETTLASYVTTNDIAGVSMGNVQTCVGKGNGNLDPNNVAGHGVANFGASNVKELYFLYGISPNAVATGTQTSGINSLCLQQALPVTISNLKAQSKVAEIELSWQASDFQNFSHFEIEKSNDAKSFETIAQVLADFQQPTYAYIDKSPVFGQNYYRIKMIDQDQKFEFSKIVSANFNTYNPYFTVINPTDGQILNLKTNLKNPQISLINSNGFPQNFNQEGVDKNLLLRTALASGLYFLNVKAENFEQSHRVIVR